jgi:hypothetical protein
MPSTRRIKMPYRRRLHEVASPSPLLLRLRLSGRTTRAGMEKPGLSSAKAVPVQTRMEPTPRVELGLDSYQEPVITVIPCRRGALDANHFCNADRRRWGVEPLRTKPIIPQVCSIVKHGTFGSIEVL